jgi:hypothetical protein
LVRPKCQRCSSCCIAPDHRLMRTMGFYAAL